MGETPLTSRQEHKTLVRRQINVTTISKLEKLADKFLLLEALRQNAHEKNVYCVSSKIRKKSKLYVQNIGSQSVGHNIFGS